jgi:hypothetical protein
MIRALSVELSDSESDGDDGGVPLGHGEDNFHLHL